MTKQGFTAKLRLLLLLPLPALAACEAPTGCDPARAGFLESLNCSQGGFQQRQFGLEQDLAASRANALEQQANASQAGAEARAAQRDLAQRRAALRRLDAKLADLRGQLQAAQNRPGVDQAAVQRASGEMNALQLRESQASHDNPSEAELRSIEEWQRKMLTTINNL